MTESLAASTHVYGESLAQGEERALAAKLSSTTESRSVPLGIGPGFACSPRWSSGTFMIFRPPGHVVVTIELDFRGTTQFYQSAAVLAEIYYKAVAGGTGPYYEVTPTKGKPKEGNPACPYLAACCKPSFKPDGEKYSDEKFNFYCENFPQNSEQPGINYK
ncbi:hypothetical protein KEM48_008097 [Puccinia striiformis f. sp. tritici PST-130]|nr:hypothetical protein KEM48_008097 [Puccinia striiformis f. sp. tritici PST-130]